jgi:hypothetical protein
MIDLSSTAFSMPRLSHLDIAILQTVLTFNGVEKGSDAEKILAVLYQPAQRDSEECGLPIGTVGAVTQIQDESTLYITVIGRIVRLFKGHEWQSG